MSVIIVGGGLAGLAAAVALTGRGARVTLLESRSRVGGRATSIVDSHTGSSIDNCQHVALGCCTSFLHFCRAAGIDDAFRRESVLYFIAPASSPRRPQISRLRSSRLPAPCHLLPSLLTARFLGPRDKWRLAQAVRRLASASENQCQNSIRDWLVEHGQTETAIRRFWEPVLVSALSESLDRISVHYARKVLVEAFLTDRRGWEMHLPTVPLDVIYGRRVVEWLENRGAVVALNARVRRLQQTEGRIGSVELIDGRRLGADHYIVAVPHYAVMPLLPESMQAHLERVGVPQIESAPIASVHLWFDRPITNLPHAVLLERTSQWMFRRSPPHADGLEDGGPSNQVDRPQDSAVVEPFAAHYYQIVISAARNVADRTEADVVREVVDELSVIWPITRRATLLHARRITEKRAVFSPKPGIDNLRPPQQTTIPNLQIAGDWTQTGWPGTMESAVRSGYLAAQNILPSMVLRVRRPTRRTVRRLPPDWSTGRASE